MTDVSNSLRNDIRNEGVRVNLTTGQSVSPSNSSSNTQEMSPYTEDTIEIFTKNDRTALQKHVDFFDRNGDTKITLRETNEGFQALGFGKIRAGILAFGVNAGLAPKTRAPGDPKLTIDTNRIELGKHPSDTDIYDENGQFSAVKFEELFENYDLDQDNALSQKEIVNFRKRNKETFASSIGSKAEFDLLIEIAGEEQIIQGKKTKVLTQQTMTDFYDGNLFYRIAGEPLP